LARAVVTPAAWIAQDDVGGHDFDAGPAKAADLTQITEEQRQMEAAAERVAAKLKAFHDGLTPDEHMALDLALRQIGTPADEQAEDVAGYTMVGVGPLTSLMAALGIVTREWVDHRVNSILQP
jgi:hypothetical protein